MNSLVDPALIDELYEAARAGVSIALIVRGICCLRPGVPGLSERIAVTSIVDRYLEHARIFSFDNGGQPEILLASADWMPRNLDHRIEIAFPLIEPALKQAVREFLQVQLADNVKARVIGSDGRSHRIPRGNEPAVRAQDRRLRAPRRLVAARFRRPRRDSRTPRSRIPPLPPLPTLPERAPARSSVRLGRRVRLDRRVRLGSPSRGPCLTGGDPVELSTRGNQGLVRRVPRRGVAGSLRRRVGRRSGRGPAERARRARADRPAGGARSWRDGGLHHEALRARWLPAHRRRQRHRLRVRRRRDAESLRQRRRSVPMEHGPRAGGERQERPQRARVHPGEHPVERRRAEAGGGTGPDQPAGVLPAHDQPALFRPRKREQRAGTPRRARSLLRVQRPPGACPRADAHRVVGPTRGRRGQGVSLSRTPARTRTASSQRTPRPASCSAFNR